MVKLFGIQILRLVLAVMLVAVISGCANKPVIKDFGLTAELVTIASEKGGMFYMLKLELAPDVPENSQGYIRYELLDKPGEFKELAIGSMGEARVLNFRSMATSAVNAGHIYTLQVQLQSSGEVVAAYNALLNPQISATVAELLNIKLL